MKQFEYRAVKQSRNASIAYLEKTLNEMGAQGWELVTQDYGQWFFKREVTEETLATQAAATEARRLMFNHLMEEHEYVVHIGDVHEAHRVNFPDCSYRTEG